MKMDELARYVAKGLVMMVGEVRAADVKESGYVDEKSGLKAKSLYITYFIERRSAFGFEVVRLTRGVRTPTVDPSQVPTHVEKGKVYAFELESLERKNGNVFGKLSLREPEEVEIEGPSVASPQGEATDGPLILSINKQLQGTHDKE
ncbi:MAG: hypothetical protein ABIT76_00140 [Chthoniobacterales bacterium]